MELAYTLKIYTNGFQVYLKCFDWGNGRFSNGKKLTARFVALSQSIRQWCPRKVHYFAPLVLVNLDLRLVLDNSGRTVPGEARKGHLDLQSTLQP